MDILNIIKHMILVLNFVPTNFPDPNIPTTLTKMLKIAIFFVFIFFFSLDITLLINFKLVISLYSLRSNIFILRTLLKKTLNRYVYLSIPSRVFRKIMYRYLDNVLRIENQPFGIFVFYNFRTYNYDVDT